MIITPKLVIEWGFAIIAVLAGVAAVIPLIIGMIKDCIKEK